jgi:hypothetical protein
MLHSSRNYILTHTLESYDFEDKNRAKTPELGARKWKETLGIPKLNLKQKNSYSNKFKMRQFSSVSISPSHSNYLNR